MWWSGCKSRLDKTRQRRIRHFFLHQRKKAILVDGLQIADKVRFVHAGCGVNALSGLQNHANSIHCINHVA
ncbi:hypothetical protein FEK42_17475 [Escherichia sp. E2748]|nr:hypothetical protein FEK42_17475 [Escherichia sp. E2748]